MEKRDYLVRGMVGEGRTRVFAVRTTDIVREAQRRHGLYPVPSAALGRVLTIGTILGAMLKGEESVTIQIRGDGPLKSIVATANSKGQVRGYVGNPHVHLPLNSKGKLAVGEAVGAGTLFVIRDLGLKETYQGAVPLQTGEIGDDFAYYFASSEQTPSAVMLGVLVDPNNVPHAAGGVVIQLLPGAQDDEVFISKLESAVGSSPPISSLFAMDKTPEMILDEMFADFDLKIIDRMPVEFACDCSRERFEAGLITLGLDELQELLDAGENVETECQFCRSTYYFSIEELQSMIEQIRSDRSDSQ